MKLYNILGKSFFCLLLLGSAVACTNEDYKLYDTKQKDSVFFDYVNDKDETVDSIDYQFQYDIATVHTVEVPVALMGMPVDHDRVISLVPVEGETTMKEGIHYTIEDAVLPANSVRTNIKINLLRDKDPEVQKQRFELKLEIKEDDDLRSVGQKFFTVTYSDIRPTERPEWWVTYAKMPVYSFEAAQVFFKYFYELAPKANPAVYQEMITAYGDYFVKAGSMQGPYAMYTNFLVKYVLMPMYQETGDQFEWQAIPSL